MFGAIWGYVMVGVFTGTADKGVVEVTNCFCVPHKEHADQVEAELNYAMDVYELNRRVNASESIVGGYIYIPFVFIYIPNTSITKTNIAKKTACNLSNNKDAWHPVQ